jgi:hypothetical protein
MWFDLVLIDRLLADGTMESIHIRSTDKDRFPVDRLEDIDPEFRDADVSDIGSLRIYGFSRMQSSTIKSKLKNFDSGSDHILLQFEHFNIPVVSGYYVLIGPKGWRFSELNIYDPYNSADNVAQKRSYRGVDLIWASESELSCAQFNMESVRRGTFSIGVIASLKPSSIHSRWIDRNGSVDVKFTDQRHHHHPLEEGFRAEADKALEKVKSESAKMPAINVSLTGPSINIVEWARYIKDKIRKPKSN